jgi:hypothetical protein
MQQDFQISLLRMGWNCINASLTPLDGYYISAEANRRVEILSCLIG